MPESQVRSATGTFEEQRRRLMGVSYRILGSFVDAEDVVQDAWLRWSATDVATVKNPAAFLTTVVTRLSLDRLRTLKARREVYAGPWLPEPVAVDADPEAAAELADSLSMALLVVLETLSPLERAAFVLREAFSEPYAVVAEVIGRDEAAVRQLVHRARQHVDAGAARYRADRTTHDEVVERFLAACQTADLDALLAVLAPDVLLVSDAGGVGKAPPRPIAGEDKVARFLIGVTTKVEPGTTVGLEVFNGQVGLVARLEGRATTALAFAVAGQRVQTLHLMANPEKLAALDVAVPLD
jgi:RNA polymerase sigma-70 factor (ECF subfamily)